MNGWMGLLMDGFMDGGWVDNVMGLWVGGWMGEWIDGWVGGWMGL